MDESIPYHQNAEYQIGDKVFRGTLDSDDGCIELGLCGSYVVIRGRESNTGTIFISTEQEFSKNWRLSKDGKLTKLSEVAA